MYFWKLARVSILTSIFFSKVQVFQGTDLSDSTFFKVYDMGACFKGSYFVVSLFNKNASIPLWRGLKVSLKQHRMFEQWKHLPRCVLRNSCSNNFLEVLVKRFWYSPSHQNKCFWYLCFCRVLWKLSQRQFCRAPVNSYFYRRQWKGIYNP